MLISNGTSIFAQSKAFIPDTNFRSFLNTTYPTFMDGSGDSLLIDSAATLTGTLNCAGQNIADLTGVEYFINITLLGCGSNQLTTLPDLTNITALLRLYCSLNQLTALPDLTNNTALEFLNCFNNQLTSLPDLMNNTALQYLNCFDNQLTYLPNLMNNAALLELTCYNNKLDFSDTRELRIANTISTLWMYDYSPQNPFGVADTFNLNVGDTLILSIANQDSALSYQWFRGTDTIVGATDTLLTIPNVTLAESGVYTCRSYGTALLYPSPMTHSPGISSFVSEEFLVNISSVGISELFDTDDWLKVYPNPGTGEFIIEIENPRGFQNLAGFGVKIKLINIVGQIIYEENLSDFTPIASGQAGKYQNKIDMSGYAKGIYTLQLSTKKGIITKKIILE